MSPGAGRAGRPAGRLAIGVDLGGTNLKVAIVTAGGRPVVYRSWGIAHWRTRRALLAGMVQAIQTCVRQAGVPPQRIVGLGMGVPGLVDVGRGFVYRLINIPGWTRVPLQALMERALPYRTVVDNDVNVMALAEARYGAGRGAANVVCLTIGTGVGGALILGGQLYRGRSGSAGEIGHVPITRLGPLCSCGGRGCLERFVGNRAIAVRARRAWSRGGPGRRAALGRGPGGITPKVVAEAARAGDPVARRVWADVGRDMGIALAGLVNVLNPDRIVIGGGVANAGSLLLDQVRRTLRARALRVPARAVRVVRARLGDRAGVIGAAALAREPWSQVGGRVRRGEGA